MKLYTAISFSILVAGCGWWSSDYPSTEPTTQDTPASLPSADSETQNASVPVVPTLPEPEAIVIAPLPQPEPIVIPPIAEVPPITPEPAPETGSTNLQQEMLLAQYGPPRRHPREYVVKPVIVSFLGETATKTIDLSIPAPPSEMSACNSSVILGPGIPLVDKKHRYGDWWLIATTTSLIGFDPDTPVYFYWAKQVSAQEVGAVPTGFGTAKINPEMPDNAKINTGFAEVPYQWISRFEMLNHFPHMQEEPCEPSKPRR